MRVEKTLIELRKLRGSTYFCFRLLWFMVILWYLASDSFSIFILKSPMRITPSQYAQVFKENVREIPE